MYPREEAAAWAPTDLPDLVLWLRADSIRGLSDGDKVTTWSDESGNNNDATASGDFRPDYKINILNGLPILRFYDGDPGQYMYANGIASSFAGTDVPLTFIMVVYVDDVINNDDGYFFMTLYKSGGGGGAHEIHLSDGAPGDVELSHIGAGGSLQNPSPRVGISQNQWLIFTHTFDSAGMAWYEDGTVKQSSPLSGAGACDFDSCTIGAADSLGYIYDYMKGKFNVHEFKKEFKKLLKKQLPF